MGNRYLKWLFFCLLSIWGVNVQAQHSDRLRPRWVTHRLPENIAPTYIFLDAEGKGNSLEEARQMALLNLSTRLEHERGIAVTSSIEVDKRAERQGGKREQVTKSTFQLKAVENGKQIVMNTRVVDEYWTQQGKMYTCRVLYTVADQQQSGGSYDDEIYLTTSYGARGLAWSLIPGAGQIYKGSKVKGGLILGGEIALSTMIVVSENLRASYNRKMHEQPKFAQAYASKADNWSNIRNGFIGAAAALYLYNLVDAVVAPGARRVKVKAKNSRIAFQPVGGDDFAGLGLRFQY